MRIVIDTNKVFSAILNTDSKIARILLKTKTRLNFYSTDYLLEELEELKEKIIHISKLSQTKNLLTKSNRFINVEIIPKKIYTKTFELTKEVDIDDTEFIALTEHLNAKFWSGDKE